MKERNSATARKSLILKTTDEKEKATLQAW